DSPIPTAARELTPAQTPLIAYPNPTTGAISIAAPYNIGDEAIMVYDMTGRKVMSQRISNINKGTDVAANFQYSFVSSEIIHIKRSQLVKTPLVIICTDIFRLQLYLPMVVDFFNTVTAQQ
ncbi:MAG: T9SS type A sorting domain-containing protein, partial [Bacteroidales bacterium]|nr:T9SS type A sorting domain-containing protein [Bacteroidales bacterium]